MVVCVKCGSSKFESDPVTGESCCISCGTVSSVANLVAEVEFVETGSSSRAIGKFVGSSDDPNAQALKPSQESSVNRVRDYMLNIANQTSLTNEFVESALSFYRMALHRNLTRARKIENVAVACLYMCCRIEKTSHLLIDFTEVVKLDIFTLGKTFLFLTRALSIQLPIVDPCLYIQRFGHKLNLGDETHAICVTAVRLVSRMKRDWIHHGRRPAGLCGAAIVVAARLHGVKRSIKQIVRVVRISSSILMKRLKDFSNTRTALMTIDEFKDMDLSAESVEADPPAYIKSIQQAERLKKLEQENNWLDPEILQQVSKTQIEIEVYMGMRQAIEVGMEETHRTGKVLKKPTKTPKKLKKHNKLNENNANNNTVNAANKPEVIVVDDSKDASNNDNTLNIANDVQFIEEKEADEVIEEKKTDENEKVIDENEKVIEENRADAEKSVIAEKKDVLDAENEYILSSIDKQFSIIFSKDEKPIEMEIPAIPKDTDIDELSLMYPLKKILKEAEIEEENNEENDLTVFPTKVAKVITTQDSINILDMEEINSDYDDFEIDNCLLSTTESLYKKKMWESENAEFLLERERKREEKLHLEMNKRKRKKPSSSSNNANGNASDHKNYQRAKDNLNMEIVQHIVQNEKTINASTVPESSTLLQSNESALNEPQSQTDQPNLESSITESQKKTTGDGTLQGSLIIDRILKTGKHNKRKAKVNLSKALKKTT